MHIDERERAAAEVVGEFAFAELLEPLDEHPVGVHPGRSLPVARFVEVVGADGHAGHRVRRPVGVAAQLLHELGPADAGEQRQEPGDGRLRERGVGDRGAREQYCCVGACHRESIAAPWRAIASVSEVSPSG